LVRAARAARRWPSRSTQIVDALKVGCPGYAAMRSLMRACGRWSNRLAVRRLEQDRATIGTGVALIEARDQRPIAQVRKQNTLCRRRFVQRTRLRMGTRRLVNCETPTLRRLCFRQTRSISE
jgi:hypothetical protein